MTEKVVRVKNELFERAKAKSESEGITMADAIAGLVQAGGGAPSGCEMGQFRRVLEARGLTAPRRLDWVWGVTDVLPADMLAGSKLEPYAEARREAELRCAIGNELFNKLVKAEPELVHDALAKEAPEAVQAALDALAKSEGEEAHAGAAAEEE